MKTEQQVRQELEETRERTARLWERLHTVPEEKKTPNIMPLLDRIRALMWVLDEGGADQDESLLKPVNKNQENSIQ